MKRVVAEDLKFRGQKLRKGENLVLFYASANRDESVFEDPYIFRIDRNPNPHLAFGIGEHFCLGTHLARQSQRALLREMIGRIDTLEVAGDPVTAILQDPANFRHDDLVDEEIEDAERDQHVRRHRTVARPGRLHRR